MKHYIRNNAKLALFTWLLRWICELVPREAVKTWEWLEQMPSDEFDD